MRLDGQVVLVTGAARGLGLAIAEGCAARGADVVLADISGKAVHDAAEALSATGHSVLPVTMDVTSAADIAAVVNATLTWRGTVTGLVNNAGVLRESDAVEVSEKDWDDTFGVNVKACWLLSKEVIPHMFVGTGGSIVNMSSIEGMFARPRHTAYAASKAALINLTRSVAVDFGRHGIRCNAICPGSIETDLLRQHIDATDDPVAVEADLVSRNFLGRFGRPAEVANVAAFLLSAESSFINGASLVVDGARTANT